jgi:hypothetical protein
MGKPVKARTVPAVRAPTSTSINVDPELWRGFKVACATEGETVTRQLETLIRGFLGRHKVKAVPTHKR